MTTYKDIENYIKEKYQVYIKSCWIAHVKELQGIQMRKAPNRISQTKRVNPCPERYIPIIIETLQYFVGKS